MRDLFIPNISLFYSVHSTSSQIEFCATEQNTHRKKVVNLQKTRYGWFIVRKAQTSLHSCLLSIKFISLIFIIFFYDFMWIFILPTSLLTHCWPGALTKLMIIQLSKVDKQMSDLMLFVVRLFIVISVITNNIILLCIQMKKLRKPARKKAFISVFFLFSFIWCKLVRFYRKRTPRRTDMHRTVH